MLLITKRSFLKTLAALSSSSTGSAQTPARTPIIGWLAGIAQPATVVFVQAYLKGMRELGYVEGQNFSMAYRFADGYVERLPKLAAELIELNPAVIIAAASAQAVIVKKLTNTIPIVVPAFGDPVALGLVESEARPGGNVTGITPYVKGLPAKQLELARELITNAKKIGFLDDVTDVKGTPQRLEIEAVGAQLKIQVIRAEVRAPTDIATAFQQLATEQVEVVIVPQTNMFLGEREQIAILAASKRLPSVYGYAQNVYAGGLISYGVDLPACFHRAAYFIDRILKGTKPADLPIEFPTKLELVINLKTANALGVAIPSQLLFRADKVIE